MQCRAQGVVALNHDPEVPRLSYTGWSDDALAFAAGPKVTIGVKEPNMASDLALFGGHRLYDSVFSKFYALPYGVGDNGGCVHSILMTASPKTGASCGAGGWDAVAEYELATNNIPWYATGASIQDEDGMTHNVTFTANAAIVRPALPASYRRLMQVGMHVITNIVAGPTIYSGLGLDGVQAHRNQDQQFYGAMLSDWRDEVDFRGTYTRFDMQGPWTNVTYGQGAVMADRDHVPSPGSINNAAAGTRDSLDQVLYASYRSPILIIGTYLKHFTRNTTCQVVASATDKGGALGQHLGPSRKCDEELDNWYYGPDYGATMHGLTIGYGGTVPSNDSYGLAIAGRWPEGIRSWLGSDGIDFDGDEFKLGSRRGSPALIGAKKMMAEWWQEPTANIGYVESVKLWAQTDSISQAHNATINAPAAAGTDISYWLGPRQSASSFNVDGTFESAIAFNPGWAKNGVALCGASSARHSDAEAAGAGCLTVDQVGTVSAVAYHEDLRTPSSSRAPCTAGDFVDDADYHYVCVARNRWKRIALSGF